MFRAVDKGWPAFGKSTVVADLAAFGEYLANHRKPPWLHGSVSKWDYEVSGGNEESGTVVDRSVLLSQTIYLGAAALLLILEEISPDRKISKRKLGPLEDIAAYIKCRRSVGRLTELPDLPYPMSLRRRSGLGPKAASI